MSVGKNLSKIENEKVRNIYEAFSRSFLEVFHKKISWKSFFPVYIAQRAHSL